MRAWLETTWHIPACNGAFHHGSNELYCHTCESCIKKHGTPAPIDNPAALSVWLETS